jgi:hypothetical protein
MVAKVAASEPQSHIPVQHMSADQASRIGPTYRAHQGGLLILNRDLTPARHAFHCRVTFGFFVPYGYFHYKS